MMPDFAAALSASIDLPTHPRSVPTARHLLSELLIAWDADRFRDDANLLVSELVTNVVRYVDDRTSPMVLEVHLSGPGLRVAVVDSSSARAALVDQPSSDGGHGLSLVDALSERWGTEPFGDGKRVWFELRG
ncbi:ATP-binding protein [Pseudonocardia broussonetiae]|uniref:ATP-binding protein n=2 Tax=Pseudonocardia broussonetiae TaxID=2736640 RepID=A0A6M6JI69_9PSEU|nr:ATP-binding protein [Pseudonocardia broussonetiae]QJY47764.1 ATP-binding protein [Pseudonocardia broussonetiae]